MQLRKQVCPPSTLRTLIIIAGLSLVTLWAIGSASIRARRDSTLEGADRPVGFAPAQSNHAYANPLSVESMTISTADLFATDTFDTVSIVADDREFCGRCEDRCFATHPLARIDLRTASANDLVELSTSCGCVVSITRDVRNHREVSIPCRGEVITKTIYDHHAGSPCAIDRDCAFSADPTDGGADEPGLACLQDWSGCMGADKTNAQISECMHLGVYDRLPHTCQR